MNWLNDILGVRGTSDVVGIVELATAPMLIAGAFNSFASALGAAISSVTYINTPTFFLSTLGVAEHSPGGFPAISALGQILLEDLMLLAASVLLLLGSAPPRLDPRWTSVRSARLSGRLRGLLDAT